MRVLRPLIHEFQAHHLPRNPPIHPIRQSHYDRMPRAKSVELRNLVLGSLCMKYQYTIVEMQSRRRIERTLVDISLGVVSRLVCLVLNGIDTGAGAGGKAGIAVLGNLLVGLLGGGGGSTLNGLRYVVRSLLEGR